MLCSKFVELRSPSVYKNDAEQVLYNNHINQLK